MKTMLPYSLRRTVYFALALSFGACTCNDKKSTGSLPAVPPPVDDGGLRCIRDIAFPENIDLPEASAAAEVELKNGVREILVVSDGHKGKVFAWRPPMGPSRTFHLELDTAASGDTEGMAWRDGKLYTLTSSGAVRVFVPDGQGGLRREGGATRIGPPPFSCEKLEDKQCGYNFEGLCLRPSKQNARCAGYAASKEHNQLVCVKVENGALVIDPKDPIVFKLHKHALSDCAFGNAESTAEGMLFITTNSKGSNITYAVDEKSGALRKLDVEGTSSNEAVTVDFGGAIYVFADGHEKKSEGRRYTCSGW